jgi:chromosome segregation ATPase
MLEKQRDEQTATEAALQKLRRELDGRASNLSLTEENLKAKDASLEERAMALVWQEKDLVWREHMWERREMLLAEHELEVEEKERKLEEKERTLEERVRRFQATQAAQVAPVSQAVEAMKKTLEDLRAEHRTGAQRIAAWVDDASSALVPLGVSPIPVSKQSLSISDALPVLDSAADRLRRLDQILGARLEAEGSRLGGNRVRPDVLPEPRPGHLLGAGDRRSGGRYRRRRPGERTRRCRCGGQALLAGSR